jgi:elongation factor Ts
VNSGADFVYTDVWLSMGEPEELWDGIVEGMMKIFFEDNTLLKQPFVKDPDRTVEALLTEVSARTGENLVVRRFVRYALGI